MGIFEFILWPKAPKVQSPKSHCLSPPECGGGHLAGEICPLQQGFCSPQSTSHANDFYFCLLFR